MNFKVHAIDFYWKCQLQLWLWQRSTDLVVGSSLICIYAHDKIFKTQRWQFVLKGEQLVSSRNMCTVIKQSFHTSHLGEDNMLWRPRELVYWPGMTQDIKQVEEACETCQLFSKQQPQKPIITTPRRWSPLPGRWNWPLLTARSQRHCLSVDYLSSFCEVDFLTSVTTTAIITKLKANLARYCILQVIMTDSAQFISREFPQFVTDWGLQHITALWATVSQTAKLNEPLKQLKPSWRSASGMAQILILFCWSWETLPYRLLIKVLHKWCSSDKQEPQSQYLPIVLGQDTATT